MKWPARLPASPRSPSGWKWKAPRSPSRRSRKRAAAARWKTPVRRPKTKGQGSSAYQRSSPPDAKILPRRNERPKPSRPVRVGLGRLGPKIGGDGMMKNNMRCIIRLMALLAILLAMGSGPLGAQQEENLSREERLRRHEERVRQILKDRQQATAEQPAQTDAPPEQTQEPEETIKLLGSVLLYVRFRPPYEDEPP